MSVNVYLKNSVRECSGFKSEPCRDGSGDRTSINGMGLLGGKGRLYIMWDDNGVIPDQLKDFVEEISCYQTIPRMSHRESGVYMYESARCELLPADEGSSKQLKPVYHLRITAKNLEDIQVLAHKVKVGSIRPDESYEGKQSGMSRAQIEFGLERARAMVQELQGSLENIERMADDLKEGRERALQKLTRLLNFAEVIATEAWPFCAKGHVAKKIAEIVKDSDSEQNQK